MSQPTPAPSQRMLNEAFGTFLIGTWLSVAVFSFELTQIYRYFTLYPFSCTSVGMNGRRRDRIWTPIMILFMLMMNITSTFMPLASAYTWLVTNWGNPAQTNAFLLSIYGVASAISICVMHLFLLSRYYALSRQAALSAILFCMALVTCALFMTCSILSGTTYTRREDRNKMKSIVVSWLSCSVATDWLIVGALTWTLSKIRPNVNDRRGLISRITRLSILSGSVPTFLAVCCLISYLCSPYTSYSLIFSQSLGSACTLTVLFNLNSRSTLAECADGNTETSGVIYVLDTAAGQPSDGW